jgi:DnaJ homolog subfamily A member 5
VGLALRYENELKSGIRLMEKDNKKARDDAKREYNDAVRVSTWLLLFLGLTNQLPKDLVRFLRKRDKRYKNYMTKQRDPSSQSATPPTTKSSATPIAKFVEQEWQRVNISNEGNEAGQWDDAEGAEEWECVACAKAFKSEAAWMTHERSRKHLKEVERYVKLPVILHSNGRLFTGSSVR